MSSQLVPELVVMQLAAPVPEQTRSVDELPVVANRSTHVKLTHSLVQTQRHYLGYLSSGENFLLSSWTSWHTSTTTGSYRWWGWYRGIRCSCPSRQTLPSGEFILKR